ncbi:hypothetical protein ASG52_06800 [Methylobacterium sp. Leaf456]|nr:hypothetical protein ASG52_06800 [Methylobacterium sp. Leaf456]
MRAFLRHIEGRTPIRAAILFGSRARGTHTAESDADLAVVLAGSVGDRRAASRDMAGIAFEALLETGILIDALPLWEGEFDRSVAFRNPALIDAIRHEGRRL